MDQCITEKQHCGVDTISYLFEFLDDFQDMPHTEFYHRFLNVFFKPTTAIEASFENPDIPKQVDGDISWGPIIYNKQLHPLMLMVSYLVYIAKLLAQLLCYWSGDTSENKTFNTSSCWKSFALQMDDVWCSFVFCESYFLCHISGFLHSTCCFNTSTKWSNM